MEPSVWSCSPSLYEPSVDGTASRYAADEEVSWEEPEEEPEPPEDPDTGWPVEEPEEEPQPPEDPDLGFPVPGEKPGDKP